MKKKTKRTFRKDILFKLMIAGEDEASHYIRKVIIDGTIQLAYNHLIVINPEMIPNLEKEKTMIFDTLFETDTGELI